MRKNKCKSKAGFSKLLIGALVVFSVPLTLAGCRSIEINQPQSATEFLTERLELSDEQSKKVLPITEDFFAEREDLRKMRKALNDEILAQMRNDTVDAAKMEAVLNESLEQLQTKLAKFSNSFAEFHAILTPEQRSELVEKLEKRRKHAGKRGRGGHWGRRWF